MAVKKQSSHVDEIIKKPLDTVEEKRIFKIKVKYDINKKWYIAKKNIE